jgi:hypothetical protein
MKARLMLAMASFCILTCRAEIVDRIAATVGTRVIAESEVMEEARLTAFIEGSQIDLSPDGRRKVLDRMIDQTLMRREIEFVRFQPPPDQDLAPLLDQVKSKFGNEQAYRDGLVKYGITEQDVLAHLKWQVTMLRFIEYRFQPSVEVTTSLIRQEYRQQTRGWKEKNGTEPPSMESIRDELERIVRQRLVDSAMDRWLGEVRTQMQIRYHEGYQ